MLSSNEIAPLLKVKSELSDDESVSVMSVIFAAMPVLRMRMLPLAIVTVTNVCVPLPSSSRTFSRSIEIWVGVFVNVKVPVSRWPKASRKTSVPLTTMLPAASVAPPTGCGAAVVFSRSSNVPPTLMPGMVTATVAWILPKTPALVSSRTPLPFVTVTKSRWSVPSRRLRFAIVMRLRVSSSAVPEPPKALSSPSLVKCSTVKSPRTVWPRIVIERPVSATRT